jgi:hypothetical protein
VKRNPVESSAITSIGYDVELKILEVEFVSGAVYRYFGSPRVNWAEHVEARPRGGV